VTPFLGIGDRAQIYTGSPLGFRITRAKALFFLNITRSLSMPIRFKQDSRSVQQEWHEPWSRDQHSESCSPNHKSSSKSVLPLAEAERHPTLSKLNTQSPQSRLKNRLSSVSLWQRLHQGWDNSSFRTKLAIVLVGTATLPAIVGTSLVVALASHRLTIGMQHSVQSDLSILEQDLAQVRQSNKVVATALAKVVEASELDLSNKDDLKTSLTLVKEIGQGGSFRIITDAKGKTVAQNIQILGDDFSDNPPLANKPSAVPHYHLVSLPPGIKLGDIPIVKDALNTGRLMAGTELWNGDDIQRLGLEKQATIGFRSQKFQWLSKSQRPFEDGTVFKDTDSGNAGLVIAAVQPIRAKGKIIGAAIVGTLLNRNFPIVDALKQKTGVETAALFAQDSIVTTNIPYPDDNSRALGTKAASEVADAVINRGGGFIGKTNVLQDDYLTAYSPLYDHRHQLDQHVLPVGMAYVGDSSAKVLANLAALWKVGYGLGGGILLLASLVAVPIASSFSRPIRRLTAFAQQIGNKDSEARLETVSRRDEIGGLSQQLNQLAVMIELSQDSVRHQEDLRYEAEKQIKAFAAIPEQIRQSFNLEDILKAAAEEIQSALNTERVLIYRFSGNQEGTIAAESVATWHSNAVGVEIKGSTVHPQNIKNCYIKLSEDLVVLARLVAPIMVNNQLFGLVIAHDSKKSRLHQQFEIDLFTQAVAQLGIALEQALLLEQLEKARIADELMSLEQRQEKKCIHRQLVGLLNDIGGAFSGDLTVRAEVTEGEIGTVADILNAIVESLRSLVTSVKQAANQVTVSVGENDGAIRHLVDKALIQASDMKSAVRSIEQMQPQLQAVADNASVAAVAALKASSTVEAMDLTIDCAVQNSLILRETVTATANSVLRLGESSQQIDQAMFSLNQIAQQTNVLAINASIEAARAGECGRGFGVVAEGVVKLSAQSAAATREIEQIVENIQRDTSVVAKAMELGTTQVSEVGNKIESAKKSLARILDICHQVEHLAQSNSTATGTQAQIFELVWNLMNRIDSESDRQISSVRQLANSSLESVEIAQHLTLAVETFKI